MGEKFTYQEVLVVIVPDATGVRPVTGHTGASEECRDGLVKEEVVGNELLLGGVGHFVKWVVFALNVVLTDEYHSSD